MGLSKKGVFFDLDTKKMKYFMDNLSDGYKSLEKSFDKLGFQHRQGSGYFSKEPMDITTMISSIEKVVEANPWLTVCVKKFDYVNVGKQFDASRMIKNMQVDLEFKDGTSASSGLLGFFKGMPKGKSPGAGKINDNFEE